MSGYAADLHGLTLRVECEDEEILATIAARFAHLPQVTAAEADILVEYDFAAAAHIPPAEARLAYASTASRAWYSPAEDAFYAAHEDGATMRCSSSAGVAEIRAATRAPSRSWVLTRPLLTLALMELARARGLQPLHAACLARDGGGVLVTGPSGSGKTTLTLSLLASGFDYVSEDLVFLRPEGDGVTACGFPDELGLTEDAAALFPEVGDAAVPAPGWPKGRIGVERLAPTIRVRRTCAPRLVLFLDQNAVEAEEISSDAALLELLPSMLMTDPETCRQHMAALSSLASAARCLRLPARPDLDAVAELVDTALPISAHLRKEALR